MFRLNRILNHCSKRGVATPASAVKQECSQSNDKLPAEYMHFWRRKKMDNNTSQTETQYLHDTLHRNDYFLNEVNADREALLTDITAYHQDGKLYDTKQIMDIFVMWIGTAFKYSPSFISHPNAVCVSTIDSDHYPTSRYVLLKTIDVNNGEFIFFTNFNSQKSRSILEVSNKVCMTFYWDILDLQVRVKGTAVQIDHGLNDEYWKTRPRQSKLSAITSDQSQPIASKSELETKYEEIERENKDKADEEIARPSNWGGFGLSAEEIEYWNGHQYRFHDRSVFRKQAEGKWKVTRLQP